MLARCFALAELLVYLSTAVMCFRRITVSLLDMLQHAPASPVQRVMYNAPYVPMYGQPVMVVPPAQVPVYYGGYPAGRLIN